MSYKASLNTKAKSNNLLLARSCQEQIKKIFIKDHKKNFFFRAPMTSRHRTTATYKKTSFGE
jgi:Tfp pilus assembly ATPase PilU